MFLKKQQIKGIFSCYMWGGLCSLPVSKDQRKTNVKYVFPWKNPNVSWIDLPQVPKGFINSVHVHVFPSQFTLESLSIKAWIQLQSEIQAWRSVCSKPCPEFKWTQIQMGWIHQEWSIQATFKNETGI